MRLANLRISTEIISSLGFSTIRTTLMDCVANAFQVIGLLIGGYVATSAPNCMYLYTIYYRRILFTRSLLPDRIIVATAGNIICLIAAGCLAFLPSDRNWMRLVAFW